MKLHLGCGRRYLPGYVHIDVCDEKHIDMKMDIRKLTTIADNSVDDIYASHVLEHFARDEIFDILQEWNRVLKLGGTIHIAVPNFAACVEQYNQRKYLPELIGLICGGQKDTYDMHKMIFDEKILGQFLQETGFINIKPYNNEDYLPEGYDDWSRCYLPHMDFNGRHMSLNMTGTKHEFANANPSTDLLFAMGIKRAYEKK